MKPSLAELMIMSGLNIQPYGSNETRSKEYNDPIKYRGLTGSKWTKRKSRSKIAKQSKKRNRR